MKPEQEDVLTPEQEQVRKRAWEYHKEADVLFAARANYSMVAQSMLLVSFMTIFAVQNHTVYTKIIEIAVAMFGIWYAYNQYLLSRSLSSKMKLLKGDYLEKLDPIYRKYMKAEPGRPSGIQTKRIPGGLAVLWFLLANIALING